MRRDMLTILLIFITSFFCIPCQLTAQALRPPELTIPRFDAIKAGPSDPTGDAVFARQEMPSEAIEFIRGVALLLIPQEFTDDDGWGDETKVQSGLNMRFENGQLRTSRRWKHINHGNWRQASGKLVEPEETFRLNAASLSAPEQGIQRYDIDVSARLRVTGQQQQWSYGIMLWSISAEAVADVNLHLVLDVKSEVVQTDKGTRLRFLPVVHEAEAKLTDFNLRRISNLKGKPVQEFGDWFENLIQWRVARENKKLTNRINAALEKKPERLEIPFDIAGWFNVAAGHEKAAD